MRAGGCLARHYCPLCDERLADTACAVHGVETIDLAMLNEAAPLARGDMIAGRYAIEEFVAEGGAGAIYRARQVCVDRTVALKILRRERASDLQWLGRFYREARLASRLSHPNIVQILEFGVDGRLGIPFIAMEYIEGQTLESMLGNGRRFTERHAAELLQQVAKALAEAHRRGVVHCDLKPENIMVSARDGEEHVKVLDFGIAKTIDGPASDPSPGKPGAAVGTPAYMSPEQIIEKPIDFRSDLYALGCILHELLEGRPPFSAETTVGLLFGHLRDPAPSLSAKLVDGEAPSGTLIRLHEALLAKEVSCRPPNAESVARVLVSISRAVERTSRFEFPRWTFRLGSAV